MENDKNEEHNICLIEKKIPARNEKVRNQGWVGSNCTYILEEREREREREREVGLV